MMLHYHCITHYILPMVADTGYTSFLILGMTDSQS